MRYTNMPERQSLQTEVLYHYHSRSKEESNAANQKNLFWFVILAQWNQTNEQFVNELIADK